MPKKIPYGISNFESIMLENYIYVDKTRFIEMLENEPTKYHFLIRPRKFGKSLFLSMLWNYYDIVQKDKFEQLFGNLYIGKHPTGRQNSMFVLRFSFAGIDTSNEENFTTSFTEKIKLACQIFFAQHKDIIDDIQYHDKEIGKLDKISSYLEYVIKFATQSGRKLYVIIDEYDHYAT
ncbi:MAG: AAA family ATPase, partial [Bacteroidales bacterium]|nr:AAA family ATPase [Bacteroidales bacterium]